MVGMEALAVVGQIHQLLADLGILLQRLHPKAVTAAMDLVCKAAAAAALRRSEVILLQGLPAMVGLGQHLQLQDRQ
jgi:hypothetical protein